MVWNRKNLSRDSSKMKQLPSINELEYYLIDNYKLETDCNSFTEGYPVKFSNYEV